MPNQIYLFKDSIIYIIFINGQSEKTLKLAVKETTSWLLIILTALLP
jgi:hypothetical protein